MLRLLRLLERLLLLLLARVQWLTRSQGERLARWHELHDDELLRTGDPVAAVAAADAQVGLRPEDRLRGELRRARRERERLVEQIRHHSKTLGAAKEEIERLAGLNAALEKKRGYITIAVPTETVELATFGEPTTTPLPAQYVEVTLGPPELREAAHLKLARHAERPWDPYFSCGCSSCQGAFERDRAARVTKLLNGPPLLPAEQRRALLEAYPEILASG